MNIKVFKDGDAWCALIGEDLEYGICGFGETKFDAAKDLFINIDKICAKSNSESEKIKLCKKYQRPLGEKCFTHEGFVENCENCPYHL